MSKRILVITLLFLSMVGILTGCGNNDQKEAATPQKEGNS